MKKLHIAMAIAASVSTAAIAQAEDYQVEGGLSVTDPDSALDNRMGLDGRYHFETVSTSGTVLNEAAFVGRNNNVHAYVWDQDIADGSTIGVEWWFEDIYVGLDFDDSSVAAPAAPAAAGAAAALAAALGVPSAASAISSSVSDIEEEGGAGGADPFSPVGGAGAGGTNTIVQAGYMIQENTLIAVGFTTGDVVEDIINVRVKHVGELGGQTINLEANVSDDSVNSNYGLGGDYYFSETLSAGLDIQDGDSFADMNTAINVKNFFTPKISGEFVFSDNGTTNPMSVRVAMRF